MISGTISPFTILRRFMGSEEGALGYSPLPRSGSKTSPKVYRADAKLSVRLATRFRKISRSDKFGACNGNALHGGNRRLQLKTASSRLPAAPGTTQQLVELARSQRLSGTVRPGASCPLRRSTVPPLTARTGLIAKSSNGSNSCRPVKWAPNGGFGSVDHARSSVAYPVLRLLPQPRVALHQVFSHFLDRVAQQFRHARAGSVAKIDFNQIRPSKTRGKPRFLKSGDAGFSVFATESLYVALHSIADFDVNGAELRPHGLHPQYDGHCDHAGDKGVFDRGGSVFATDEVEYPLHLVHLGFARDRLPSRSQCRPHRKPSDKPPCGRPPSSDSEKKKALEY